jgi:hypothetical protein
MPRGQYDRTKARRPQRKPTSVRLPGAGQEQIVEAVEAAAATLANGVKPHQAPEPLAGLGGSFDLLTLAVATDRPDLLERWQAHALTAEQAAELMGTIRRLLVTIKQMRDQWAHVCGDVELLASHVEQAVHPWRHFRDELVGMKSSDI